MTAEVAPDAITTASVATLDALPSLVGAELTGEWFQLAPSDLDRFDEAAHLTESLPQFEPAGYPDGLIEGFHVLSLLDHLSSPLLRVEERGIVGWNYGLDRVRFVSPVTLNDPLRMRATVAEVRPKGAGYLVRLECTVEAQGRDKPAMVASWLALWVRDEADDTDASRSEGL